jgi:putative two-component system response regulator
MSDKYSVLIVDEAENTRILSNIFKNKGYLCSVAGNGKEALEKTRTFKPDIIFFDTTMPGTDVYQVCDSIKSDPLLKKIIVVMVTFLEDKEARARGLAVGADDFLIKPIDMTRLLIRTKNLLKVKEFETFLSHHNYRVESEVTKRTMKLNVELELAHCNSHDELKKSYLDTIYRLTIVAEHKDEGTHLHIKRVALYCAHIARELGLSCDHIETIQHAAPLHDIGKLGIPSDILLKTSMLTPEEYALMKTHTTAGARVLSGSRSDFLRMAERIALTHHERWDGTGYPQGLQGDAIPLEGRIMSIADQYDSLRSKRPYKPAYDSSKAFRIITNGDGRTHHSHFDPKILEVFKDTHSAFDDMFDSFEALPFSLEDNELRSDNTVRTAVVEPCA